MRRLTLKRRRFLTFLTFFLSIFLSLCLITYFSLSPAFINLAKAGSGNHMRSLLYSAALTVSESEDFSDMTIISRNNGKITDVSLNSEKANKIRSLFAKKVNASFADKDYSTFRIPLGNLTKLPILSGRGPKISLRIVPLGSLDADIISEFSDAGINQTKHTVYIKAKAKVSLMAPFSSCISETETTIPLSETIIVGEVPYLYASG